MNRERVLKLADFLETLAPEKFNMSVYGYEDKVSDCGTIACIAGWAVVHFDGTSIDRMESEDIHNRAKELLGVPTPLDGDLFVPFIEYSIDMKDVTTAEAAEVLRKYAATGEVSWSDVVERQRTRADQLEKDTDEDLERLSLLPET